MSNCSSCGTPPSGEQEPTLATMPVVGSGTTNTTSWENSGNLSEPSHNLCVISSIVNNNNSSSASSNLQMSSAIQEVSSISEDAISSSDFLHSRIIQDVDQSSRSLNMCEDMLVDEPLRASASVSAIVSHESICREDSDSSNDHLNVMDNITAQNFLREPDLLNAATSVLHREKSSPGVEDDIIGKSDISHNLMSSLDNDASQESEPMEMQNLLHDRMQDLDGPPISSYRLDHSQTSNLSGGSSSQLDIEVNSAEDLPSEDLCFSPSSVSNASDLNLSMSSNIGLPPVSTIIRSSSAKGRFDSFCRQPNISMIMNIPQFINSSGSYDGMSSMSAIQRISADHCDAVSLTSPLDVSSSRPVICTDLAMGNVDVPSLVCSTASSDLNASAIRCIRTTSSVMMSALAPGKDSHLSEMADSQMQSTNSLNLLRENNAFPGCIPIRDMHFMDNPPTQVSLLSTMRMEDIQKVAALSEHLRSEASSIDGSLCCSTDDDALTQSIIAPHYSSRGTLSLSECFRNSLSQPSQSLPLFSVSAIETNVIMSTSNMDSTLKLKNSNIKCVETSHHIKEQRNLENMRNHLENSGVLSENPEVSRCSSIIFGKQISTNVPSFTSAGTITSQRLMSRSSIIERNLQHSMKRDSPAEMSPSNGNGAENNNSQVKLENMDPLRMSPKLEESTPSEENSSQSLSSISPSAVTASVIQQLLKAQASQLSEPKPSGQRGVITSVTSAKSELTSSAPPKADLEMSPPVKDEDAMQRENINDMSPAQSIDNNMQRTLLVNMGGGRRLSIYLSDESLDAVIDKSNELALDSDKHQNFSALPFFPNISASAIASLKSSLPASMQNADGTPVSLLSSLQSSFITPAISGVSSILLPNILTSTLRSSASAVKTTDAGFSNASSMYSGLLKSVGLSTVVKQEPDEDDESGPLPPFTVVSGFQPLVKRELNLDLASMYLNTNNIVSSSAKQQESSKQASASEFSSSILSANSTLPEVTSVQIPSVAPIELSVVVASSPDTAILPTIPSPVPSQTSAIAFAGANSNSTPPPPPSHHVKEEPGIAKKWNCTMCKNGSPCGLHPIQSQGSSSTASTAPPPLMSGDPAKPFQCTLCGKHLASKNVYQLHLRSHSGEKPFTCNLCGHHFSQKTSLTRHMRSHTGERPFPCEACGKRFADKERIKIHMRTHTGEKPFACEVCGKRFSQKSTVKRHMSVHTGEKPFKCETCGKGFANRGNLNAHSKTHAST